MIYILIPAYNNKPEVLELLDCLGGQTYKDFKVVLVDDNSTDGTAAKVGLRFPEVIILKGDGNLWWTGANVLGVNHILKTAQADDFILLLNNDLVVPDDYLANIADAALKSGAVVGSILYDYNNRGEIKNAGILLGDDMSISLNMVQAVMPESGLKYYESDLLPGRGTLYAVEVFHKIGNFNSKKFPHYCADYEFSHRAARAGYKLIVARHAKVYAKLEITGITPPEVKTVSLKKCFMLLFSRKSKTHIVYYLNYIWCCSKKEFRIRNSLLALDGILSSTFFKTVPGYPFLVVRLIMKRIFALYRFMV